MTMKGKGRNGLHSLILTFYRLTLSALAKIAPGTFGPRIDYVRRTPEELIELLERFARDPASKKLNWDEWTAFVSTPILDDSLEAIRLECGDLMYAEDEVFARRLWAISEKIKAGLSI